jgi:hypothetical protein
MASSSAWSAQQTLNAEQLTQQEITTIANRMFVMSCPPSSIRADGIEVSS